MEAQAGGRRARGALGAKLRDREATLARAVELVGDEIGPVEAPSAWLATEAIIHPDDPATTYPPDLNGVLPARTALEPEEVLRRLHAIEARLGRDRNRETARWRPRTVDLDLVALDDVTLDTPELRLPHPEMQKRRFVLAPMAEVWPDWRHPRLGATTAELLGRLEEDT